MFQPDSSDSGGVSSLVRLRRFSGDAKAYWPLFLDAAREVTGVKRAVLAVCRQAAVPDGGAPIESWRVLASSPRGGATLPSPETLALARAEGLAESAEWLAFAVGSEAEGAGVVALEGGSAPRRGDLPMLLSLLAVLPDAWQAERTVRRLQDKLEGLAGALDLGLVIGSQTKFTAAALATCNELAARLACDRVSLGWQDDQVMRLQGISQADKFDRRAAIVRQAEVAMEEAFDQERILRWPPPDGDEAIVREQAAYGREASVPHLAAVPLRAGGEMRGVWLLERSRAPFRDQEAELLQVMADQAGPRLEHLRERDRWWPVRLWRRLKRSSAGWLGPRHTGPKLIGLALALLLLFLVFGRLPYSVEVPATVRSDHVVFVTAPFDGFVDSVHFEVGDTVAAGTPLVRFDTRELLVQQAAELAELNRFRKEAERARAQNALADLRVAEAQVERAEAVLARTRHRLAQAVVEAPMDGVVVEGDLRRRLGAPVRQGDVLLQQARLEELHIQLEIPEDEVHEVLGRTEARMLFAARPDQAYPLEITRVQPGGTPVTGGVVFVARADSAGPAPEWWRPGMSGTVRVEVGWRNAGWILTHRTTAWIRRQLWW